MLKFINNRNAFISLNITNLALIIASAILLSIVFSFIFLNDNHKEVDIKNIATSFSNIIEGMDTRFFENTTQFWFPNKDYQYNVLVSTEFIVVITKRNWGDNYLSFNERFIVKPWPSQNNSKWITKEDFHNYLNNTYLHTGKELDPIEKKDIISIKNELFDERDNINLTLALNPITIDINKPVFIEKVFVYLDNNDNFIWDKTIDEKIGFVIFYQI